MKDETRIRSAAGRKVLADPRTHRYYLCLNDEEDEKVYLHVRAIRHEEQGRIYLRPHLRLRVQGSED